MAALSHNGIKQDLDKFLQTRHQPVNFLAELPGKLRLSAHEVCACACVSIFLSVLYVVVGLLLCFWQKHCILPYLYLSFSFAFVALVLGLTRV